MDITVDRQHAPGGRRPRRVPWSPRAWGQALYLAGGIPPQLVIPAIVFCLVLVSERGSVGVARTLPFWWLAGIVLIFWLSPALTRVHRHRLWATAGVQIPPQRKRTAPLSWPTLSARLRAQSTWRQLGYHVLLAPLIALAAALSIGVWAASIVCTLFFPLAFVLRHPGNSSYSSAASQPLHHPAYLAITLIGLAGLIAAPWITAGVASLDARAARALLGPSRADELEHRVEQLTETRAGVVDAADAERRRLERDLHDGTQQRLVSLAMNLGMARTQAETADDARLAIAEAHEEAKAALAELRDLIRGLHPAVLEDRGLDAALSGVAARMPIPVRLTVDMPRRPAPVIEAVAYFVVSEGLSNIVKHAEATEAAVFVQRTAGRLHVIVTDDGVGGADPARGTGLAGLARRAASVDGTFEIDSPPGGPTLLTVDLPCNR